ncbi:DUF2946 family protein [Rosenbergiella australiborealis]|uniref:DUF2946 family protein n=1 Tax=Rosenbergiella australiborealis TaxID=1544696 RepID=A0ABS5T2T3_9GAMM|nr:DUF2946 family protein [Rosenbergiella australiborealis]MBT0726668.1 DUF2946 family protein [Rosenbergiella australiborealis]
MTNLHLPSLVQRWTAQLAMLTLALLFMGPTVSSHITRNISPVPSSAPLAVMISDHCLNETTSGKPLAETIEGQQLDTLACGYCSLWAHIPVIPLLILLTLLHHYAPIVVRHFPRFIGLCCNGYWLPSHARAPPFS